MTSYFNLYLIITAFGSIEMVELQRDLVNDECHKQVMLLSKKSELPFISSYKSDENKTVKSLAQSQPVYACYFSKVES